MATKTSPNTFMRYQLALMTIHTRVRNDPRTSIYGVAKECKITSSIGAILQDLDILKRDRSNWIWVARSPDNDMVHAVIQENNHRVGEAHARRAARQLAEEKQAEAKPFWPVAEAEVPPEPAQLPSPDATIYQQLLEIREQLARIEKVLVDFAS